MKYFKWWENTQQNQINYRLHFRFLVVISWCHLSGDICLVTLLSDICLVTSAGWHLSGVICLMSSAWCHLTSDICLVSSDDDVCLVSSDGDVCLVSSDDDICLVLSDGWHLTCDILVLSAWCFVSSAWWHVHVTNALLFYASTASYHTRPAVCRSVHYISKHLHTSTSTIFHNALHNISN